MVLDIGCNIVYGILEFYFSSKQGCFVGFRSKVLVQSYFRPKIEMALKNLYTTLGSKALSLNFSPKSVRGNAACVTPQIFKLYVVDTTDRTLVHSSPLFVTSAKPLVYHTVYNHKCLLSKQRQNIQFYYRSETGGCIPDFYKSARLLHDKLSNNNWLGVAPLLSF